MNESIKQTGILLFVGDTKSWFPKAIMGIQGSMWHHMGMIVRTNGRIKVFEEKTIWGAGYTDLQYYLDREKAGKCKLAFARLNNFDLQIFESNILNECEELVALFGYSIPTVFKHIPRQLLQRVGVDIKFKGDIKKGTVCSGIVFYILNKFTNRFPHWSCISPDDGHKLSDITFIQHEYEIINKPI